MRSKEGSVAERHLGSLIKSANPGGHLVSIRLS